MMKGVWFELSFEGTEVSRHSQVRQKGALGKGGSMTRCKMLTVYMGVFILLGSKADNLECFFVH